jgi:Tfp pilus assembly protein PilE
MKKYAGVTLLEMMLVLAIAAALLAFGLNQFQQYSRDATVKQLQYNVDKIFVAMSQFYQANCRQAYSAAGTIAPYTASLDPRNTSQPSVAVLNQTQNLLTPFLLAPSWPPTPNGLIDATAAAGGNNGYIAQFNLVTVSPGSSTPPNYATPMGIYYTWEKNPSGDAIQSTPAFSTTVGTIYTWRAQVAVKLDVTLIPVIKTFMYRTGADCTSALNGTTVYSCADNQPGEYLVWERLPSLAASQTVTSWWLTMPVVKQFTQQYTNDDMYGAYYPTWGAPTSGGGPMPTGMNTSNTYLCGG